MSDKVFNFAHLRRARLFVSWSALTASRVRCGLTGDLMMGQCPRTTRHTGRSLLTPCCRTPRAELRLFVLSLCISQWEV